MKTTAFTTLLQNTFKHKEQNMNTRRGKTSSYSRKPHTSRGFQDIEQNRQKNQATHPSRRANVPPTLLLMSLLLLSLLLSSSLLLLLLLLSSAVVVVAVVQQLLQSLLSDRGLHVRHSGRRAISLFGGLRWHDRVHQYPPKQPKPTTQDMSGRTT